MKLKLNSVWLTLFATTLLFPACKKEAKEIYTAKIAMADVTPAEDPFVTKARNFYTGEVATKRAATENTWPIQTFGIPAWDIAERIPEDTSILRVPMTNYSFTGFGYANFLFRNNASGNMTGVIVQVIFEPSYLDKKRLEYKNNNRLLVPMRQDFSGVISHWDLNGNFLGGRSWGNGTIYSDYAASIQTSNTAHNTDPDDPENDDPDWGENPDPNGGSSEPMWVIDLPGVTITPNPSMPLPGWTFSDPPPAASSFPPGEPQDYFPSNSVETGPSNPSAVSEDFSLLTELIDMISGSVPTCPIFVTATKVSLKGLIEKVYGYTAAPVNAYHYYSSEGRSVTRYSTISEVRGHTSPLPSPATRVTWEYTINWRYTYVPYYNPLVRQKRTSSVKDEKASQ